MIFVRRDEPDNELEWDASAVADAFVMWYKNTRREERFIAPLLERWLKDEDGFGAQWCDKRGMQEVFDLAWGMLFEVAT